MAKKETDKVKTQYFSADLEMVRINQSGIVYDVKNPQGVGVQNLTTIVVNRNDFPKDDNFSMNFINQDIPSQAKVGDKDAPDGVARLLIKQKEFRQFKNLKLYIVAE